MSWTFRRLKKPDRDEIIKRLNDGGWRTTIAEAAIGPPTARVSIYRHRRAMMPAYILLDTKDRFGKPVTDVFVSPAQAALRIAHGYRK